MNETDTSPEKEHVVTNDEKKENSDINFFEYGAHFKYNELCLVLAHLANNKKPTQCITLSKKEEKKKESIEIKSRNFNVNYVVKNSNYYFNEHKIITKDNKTNINKKGVIHGERILNALWNRDIYTERVVKLNLTTIRFIIQYSDYRETIEVIKRLKGKKYMVRLPRRQNDINILKWSREDELFK